MKKEEIAITKESRVKPRLRTGVATIEGLKELGEPIKIERKLKLFNSFYRYY